MCVSISVQTFICNERKSGFSLRRHQHPAANNDEKDDSDQNIHNVTVTSIRYDHDDYEDEKDNFKH